VAVEDDIYYDYSYDDQPTDEGYSYEEPPQEEPSYDGGAAYEPDQGQYQYEGPSGYDPDNPFANWRYEGRPDGQTEETQPDLAQPPIGDLGGQPAEPEVKPTDLASPYYTPPPEERNLRPQLRADVLERLLRDPGAAVKFGYVLDEPAAQPQTGAPSTEGRSPGGWGRLGAPSSNPNDPTPTGPPTHWDDGTEMTDEEKRLAQVYHGARANGLDTEGARAMVSVAKTEGGLYGAVGDKGTSFGPFQLHIGGEFDNFQKWVRDNNIPGDPRQLANDIDIATRFAASTYLGNTIKKAQAGAYGAANTSGPGLATIAQAKGQVSINPEKAGLNYTALFGGGDRFERALAGAVPPKKERDAAALPPGHYPGDGHPEHDKPTSPYGTQVSDPAGNTWTVAFDYDQPYANPFNPAIPKHRGMDLTVPPSEIEAQGLGKNGLGATYTAFQNGVVAEITNDPNGGIGIITQDQKTGLYSRYFHNSQVLVKKGDPVIAGQTPLGVLGETGTEGFPHLHFEVSKGINGDPMGQTIDPRPFVSTTVKPGSVTSEARPAATGTLANAPVPLQASTTPNQGPVRTRTDGIIVHSTNGPAATPEEEFQSTLTRFQQASSGVSAHAVINTDGTIVMVGDLDREAWHARDENSHRIGIELVQTGKDNIAGVPFTDQQYQSLAWLTGELSARYGFPIDHAAIKGHQEVPAGQRDTKIDPGIQFDWNRYLRDSNMAKTGRPATTAARTTGYDPNNPFGRPAAAAPTAASTYDPNNPFGKPGAAPIIRRGPLNVPTQQAPPMAQVPGTHPREPQQAAPAPVTTAVTPRTQGGVELDDDTYGKLQEWQNLRKSRGEDPLNLPDFRKHLAALSAPDPWAVREQAAQTQAQQQAAPGQTATRTIWRDPAGNEITEEQARAHNAEVDRQNADATAASTAAQAQQAAWDAKVQEDRVKLAEYSSAEANFDKQHTSWQNMLTGIRDPDTGGWILAPNPENAGAEPTRPVRPSTPYLDDQNRRFVADVPAGTVRRATREEYTEQVRQVQQARADEDLRRADRLTQLQEAASLEDQQRAANDTQRRQEADIFANQQALLEGHQDHLQANVRTGSGMQRSVPEDPYAPFESVPERPAHVNERIKQYYLDRGYSEEDAVREATIPGNPAQIVTPVRPPPPREVIPATHPLTEQQLEDTRLWYEERGFTPEQTQAELERNGNLPSVRSLAPAVGAERPAWIPSPDTVLPVTGTAADLAGVAYGFTDPLARYDQNDPFVAAVRPWLGEYQKNARNATVGIASSLNSYFNGALETAGLGDTAVARAFQQNRNYFDSLTQQDPRYRATEIDPFNLATYTDPKAYVAAMGQVVPSVLAAMSTGAMVAAAVPSAVLAAPLASRAAWMGTRGEWLGSALFTLPTSAGSTYEDLRKLGANPREAFIGANISGALQSALEVVNPRDALSVLTKLRSAPGGTSLTRRLLGAAREIASTTVKEGTEEASQQVADNAVQQWFGSDKSWWDQVPQNFFVGAIGGLGMGAPGAIAQVHMNRVMPAIHEITSRDGTTVEPITPDWKHWQIQTIDPNNTDAGVQTSFVAVDDRGNARVVDERTVPTERVAPTYIKTDAEEAIATRNMASVYDTLERSGALTSQASQEAQATFQQAARESVALFGSPEARTSDTPHTSADMERGLVGAQISPEARAEQQQIANRMPSEWTAPVQTGTAEQPGLTTYRTDASVPEPLVQQMASNRAVTVIGNALSNMERSLTGRLKAAGIFLQGGVVRPFGMVTAMQAFTGLNHQRHEANTLLARLGVNPISFDLGAALSDARQMALAAKYDPNDRAVMVPLISWWISQSLAHEVTHELKWAHGDTFKRVQGEFARTVTEQSKALQGLVGELWDGGHLAEVEQLHRQIVANYARDEGQRAQAQRDIDDGIGAVLGPDRIPVDHVRRSYADRARAVQAGTEGQVAGATGVLPVGGEGVGAGRAADRGAVAAGVPGQPAAGRPGEADRATLHVAPARAQAITQWLQGQGLQPQLGTAPGTGQAAITVTVPGASYRDRQERLRSVLSSIKAGGDNVTQAPPTRAPAAAPAPMLPIDVGPPPIVRADERGAPPMAVYDPRAQAATDEAEAAYHQQIRDARFPGGRTPTGDTHLVDKGVRLPDGSIVVAPQAIQTANFARASSDPSMARVAEGFRAFYDEIQQMALERGLIRQPGRYGGLLIGSSGGFNTGSTAEGQTRHRTADTIVDLPLPDNAVFVGAPLEYQAGWEVASQRAQNPNFREEAPLQPRDPSMRGYAQAYFAREALSTLAHEITHNDYADHRPEQHAAWEGIEAALAETDIGDRLLDQVEAWERDGTLDGFTRAIGDAYGVPAPAGQRALPAPMLPMDVGPPPVIRYDERVPPAITAYDPRTGDVTQRQAMQTLSTAAAPAGWTDRAFTPADIATGTGAPTVAIESNWPRIVAALDEHGLADDTATKVAIAATIAVETDHTFEPINEYGGDAYFERNYGPGTQRGRQLGNVQPGDGSRFHGRGYVQLTGRANYRDYGRRIGVDLEANPELANDPAIAARLLVLFITQNDIPQLAQRGDWQGVRRAVNGGLNGYQPFIESVRSLLSPQPVGLPSPQTPYEPDERGLLVEQPDWQEYVVNPQGLLEEQRPLPRDGYRVGTDGLLRDQDGQGAVPAPEEAIPGLPAPQVPVYDYEGTPPLTPEEFDLYQKASDASYFGTPMPEGVHLEWEDIVLPPTATEPQTLTVPIPSILLSNGTKVPLRVSTDVHMGHAPDRAYSEAIQRAGGYKRLPYGRWNDVKRKQSYPIESLQETIFFAYYDWLQDRGAIQEWWPVEVSPWGEVKAIPYPTADKGKARAGAFYNPDVAVLDNDGQRWIIEGKTGKSFIDREEGQVATQMGDHPRAKSAAAIPFLANQGYRYTYHTPEDAQRMLDQMGVTLETLPGLDPRDIPELLRRGVRTDPEHPGLAMIQEIKAVERRAFVMAKRLTDLPAQERLRRLTRFVRSELLPMSAQTIHAETGEARMVRGTVSAPARLAGLRGGEVTLGRLADFDPDAADIVQDAIADDLTIHNLSFDMVQGPGDTAPTPRLFIEAEGDPLVMQRMAARLGALLQDKNVETITWQYDERGRGVTVPISLPGMDSRSEQDLETIRDEVQAAGAAGLMVTTQHLDGGQGAVLHFFAQPQNGQPVNEAAVTHQVLSIGTELLKYGATIGDLSPVEIRNLGKEAGGYQGAIRRTEVGLGIAVRPQDPRNLADATDRGGTPGSAGVVEDPPIRAQGEGRQDFDARLRSYGERQADLIRSGAATSPSRPVRGREENKRDYQARRLAYQAIQEALAQEPPTGGLPAPQVPYEIKEDGFLDSRVPGLPAPQVPYDPMREMAMRDPGYASGTPEARMEDLLQTAARTQGTHQPEITGAEFTALDPQIMPNPESNPVWERDPETGLYLMVRGGPVPIPIILPDGEIKRTPAGKQVVVQSNMGIPPPLSDQRIAARIGWPARRWYSDFANFINDIVGFENFHEFRAVFGITSAQADPISNMMMTLSAVRIARELSMANSLTRPNFEAAMRAERYYSTRAGQIVTDRRTGEPVMVGFQTYNTNKGTAIMNVYEQGVNMVESNAKTPSYAGNLLSALLATYDPNTTMDVWMARAFNYHSKEWMQANDQAYRYMHALYNWLAREQGIPGHEIQAAVWFPIKTAVEQGGPDVQALILGGRLGEALQLAEAQGLLRPEVIRGDLAAIENSPNVALGIDRLRPVLAQMYLPPGVAAGKTDTLTYKGRKTRGRPDPARPIHEAQREAGRERAEDVSPTVTLGHAVEAERIGAENGRFWWLGIPHRFVSHGPDSFSVTLPGGSPNTARYVAAEIGRAIGLDQVLIHDPGIDGEHPGVEFRTEDGEAFAPEHLQALVDVFHEREIPFVVGSQGNYVALVDDGSLTEDPVHNAVTRIQALGIPGLRTEEYGGQAEIIRQADYAGILARLGDTFRTGGQPDLQARPPGRGDAAEAGPAAAAARARERAAGDPPLPAAQVGWSPPDQEITSAATSRAQVPAIHKRIPWVDGQTNLDYGGGAHDLATEWLADPENGGVSVTNLVYDPFNRSPEHNDGVLARVQEMGGADTATLANVLNVIREPEARQEALERAKSLLKPGAPIHIGIYPGDGSGEGRLTSNSEDPERRTWQENRKLATYLPEVLEVFPDARMRDGRIEATNGGEPSAAPMSLPAPMVVYEPAQQQLAEDISTLERRVEDLRTRLADLGGDWGSNYIAERDLRTYEAQLARRYTIATQIESQFERTFPGNVDPRVFVPEEAGEGVTTSSDWNSGGETVYRQPGGGTVRGVPINADDPRIPPVVFHATTNLPAVLDSGMLLAAGQGGLGGDKQDNVVSMTIDRQIADQIAADMKLAAEVGRMLPPLVPRTITNTYDDGRQSSYEVNDYDATPEEVTAAVNQTNDYLKDIARSQGWEFTNLDVYTEEQRARFKPKEIVGQFFSNRRYQTDLKDPLIYTDDLRSFDPSKIGVVAVPRENLKTGALLTDFDLGRGHLEEVRLYGDVPIGDEAGDVITEATGGLGPLPAAQMPWDPSDPRIVRSDEPFYSKLLQTAMGAPDAFVSEQARTVPGRMQEPRIVRRADTIRPGETPRAPIVVDEQGNWVAPGRTEPERVVEGRSAQAEALRYLLDNGVKAEEILWTGLAVPTDKLAGRDTTWATDQGWLAEQGDEIRRDDLLGYVEQNRVQVTEVLMGAGSRIPAADITPAMHAEMERARAQADEMRDRVREALHADPVRAEYTDQYIDQMYGFYALGQHNQDTDRWLDDLDGTTGSLKETLLEAKRAFQHYYAANQAVEDPGPIPTKYDNYVLPGGQQYRELLLTLPVPGLEVEVGEGRLFGEAEGRREPGRAMSEGGRVVEGVIDYPVQVGDETGSILYWPYQFDRRGNRIDTPVYVVSTTYVQNARVESLEEARAIIERAYNENPLIIRSRRDVYSSGHWPQKNILVHVRFNERTDTEGRPILFLEEIQSDWHQEGRKKGYQSEYLQGPTADDLRDARERTNEALLDVIRNGDDITFTGHGTNTQFLDSNTGQVIIDPDSPPGWNERPATEDEWRRISAWDDALAYQIGVADQIDYRPTYTGVPDAPFKTTWETLAMRRMIRWAAEHGFAQVAWTTGAQQADRYNLGAVAQSITWTRWDNADRIDLAVSMRNGDQRAIPTTRDELSNVVGESIARQILGAPSQERADNLTKGRISGEGLRIGGGGMSGFYDKILPAVANSLGKPYGAQVAPTRVSEDTEAHGLEIPPEMARDATVQGFPLFQVPYDPESGFPDDEALDAEVQAILDEYASEDEVSRSDGGPRTASPSEMGANLIPPGQAPGTIRLYRVGAQGEWFTTDKDYARSLGQDLYYVDLPPAVMDRSQQGRVPSARREDYPDALMVRPPTDRAQAARPYEELTYETQAARAAAELQAENAALTDGEARAAAGITEEVPDLGAPTEAPPEPARARRAPPDMTQVRLEMFPEWARKTLDVASWAPEDKPSTVSISPEQVADIRAALAQGPNAAMLNEEETRALGNAILLQYGRFVTASLRASQANDTHEAAWRTAQAIEEGRRFSALLSLATTPAQSWGSLESVWKSSPISGGAGSTLAEHLRDAEQTPEARRAAIARAAESLQRGARWKGPRTRAVMAKAGVGSAVGNAAEDAAQLAQVGKNLAAGVRQRGTKPTSVAITLNQQDLRVGVTDILLGFRYNNMLFGPRGILVDYGTNAAMLFYKAGTDLVMPSTGGIDPGVRLGITAAEYAAGMAAVWPAFKLAGRMILDGVSDAQIAATASPHTISGKLQVGIDLAREEGRPTVLRHLGMVNAIAWTELAGRLKGVADVAIRTIAVQMELARLAGIDIAAEGKIKIGSKEWFNEISKRVAFPTDEHRNLADREAARVVFQGPMGTVGRKLEIVQQHPLGSFILPFLRALYHIRGWAIDLHPVGAAVTLGDVMRAGAYRGLAKTDIGLSAMARTRNAGGLLGGPYKDVFRSRGIEGQNVGSGVADLDRRLMANAIGTGAFFLLLSAALAEGITDGGPPDEPMFFEDDKPDYEAIKLRDTMEAHGWQRYSIRIPYNGNHYYVSYANWGPFAIMLGSVAAIADTYRYGLPKDVQSRNPGNLEAMRALWEHGDRKTALSATRRFFGLAKDMTYLQGFMDLYGLGKSAVQANTDLIAPADETPSERIKRQRQARSEEARYVGNILTTVLPVSAITSTIAQGQDPYNRQMEFGSPRDQLASRIPGLSSLLPPEMIGIDLPRMIAGRAEGSPTGRRMGMAVKTDPLGRPEPNIYQAQDGVPWNVLPVRVSKEDMSNASLNLLVEAGVGAPSAPSEVYYKPEPTAQNKRPQAVYVLLAPRERASAGMFIGKKIDAAVENLAKDWPEEKRQAPPDEWRETLAKTVNDTAKQAKRDMTDDKAFWEPALKRLAADPERVRPWEPPKPSAEVQEDRAPEPVIDGQVPDLGPVDGTLTPTPVATPRPGATPTRTPTPRPGATPSPKPAATPIPIQSDTERQRRIQEERQRQLQPTR